MSSKNPTRYQLLQWMNANATIHDMICDCNHPNKHFLQQLAKNQEQIKINKKEYKDLQQCLTITDEETGEDLTADVGFGPGDLEAIFREDDGGEDATG